MRTLLLLSTLAIVACSGDTSDDSTTPTATSGDSGDGGVTDVTGGFFKATFHTITVRGEVRSLKGPIEGAEVWLEERNYNGGGRTQEWGRGTVTGPDGTFRFVAKEIVAVEGRWGTLVDYHLVAEAKSGTASQGVNSTIRNAVAYDGKTSPISLLIE